MKKLACIALGVAVGGIALSLIAHRRVISAMVKGEPLPEPPEWHKGHPCLSEK